MDHKPGTPDRLKDGLAGNPIFEAKCVKVETNADGLYDTPGLTNQILKHFQSRKTGSGDDRAASEGCLTSGKFPGDSAGIKFSISRILGQQVERDPVAIGTVELPCRGFQVEERSVEKMEDDFEEEEEEEDERNFSEGEDEEGDGKDGKEGILDDLLEKSQLSDSNSEQTLSWLQCTRYKPPKLPRTKKSKEGSKRRKLGRNPRVPFTQHQVVLLEQKFRHTHYLSSVDVAELSATLNLTENRVKIWFQNRRARERREKDDNGGHDGKLLPAETLADDDVKQGDVTVTEALLNRHQQSVANAMQFFINSRAAKLSPQHCFGQQQQQQQQQHQQLDQRQQHPQLPELISDGSQLRYHHGIRPFIPTLAHSHPVAIFESQVTNAVAAAAAARWQHPMTSSRGVALQPTMHSAADVFALLSSGVANKRIQTFTPMVYLR